MDREQHGGQDTGGRVPADRDSGVGYDEVDRVRGHIEAVTGVTFDREVIARTMDIDPMFAGFMDQFSPPSPEVGTPVMVTETVIDRALRIRREAVALLSQNLSERGPATGSTIEGELT